MTSLQALVFAVAQGLTELFPVSSLGHAVVLPAILGWHINQDSPDFLPFLVVLHVGTAAALLLYFWREWWRLLLALFGRGGSGAAVAERRHLILLLIVGTLPAFVLGFVFERPLRHLFGSPQGAASFLILNGFVLFLGERLRRRAVLGHRRRLMSAGWRDALAVGLWQTTAFLPGISRSGATIVGGLLVGLRHEDAARFSFLLATPVIAGAAALEIPKLLHQHAAASTGTAFGSGMLWLAGLAAGVTAYLSTAFLLRYFRSREEHRALDPFAYYCWAVGVTALLLLRFA